MSAEYMANVYLGLVIIFAGSLVSGIVIARAIARAHVRRIYRRMGVEPPF